MKLLFFTLLLLNPLPTN